MADRIIFLDIDGVVCVYPASQMGFLANQNPTLCDHSCQKLKEILDQTKAKIVLSSSWRLFDCFVVNLLKRLNKFGITAEYFVGQTNNLSLFVQAESHNKLRWLEIKDYIDRNAITEYIILDDLNLERYDMFHAVRTNKFMGITEKIKQICIHKFLLQTQRKNTKGKK